MRNRSSFPRRFALALVCCAVALLILGQASIKSDDPDSIVTSSQPTAAAAPRGPLPASSASSVAAEDISVKPAPSRPARTMRAAPAPTEPWTTTTGPLPTSPAAMVKAAAGEIGSALSATSTTATTTAPHFESSIGPIDDELKSELVSSERWRPDCPVSLEELRVITVSYWDFDGRSQTGRLIVNQAWAAQLCGVFQELFAARFPIRRMDPIDRLGLTGQGLLASDNTMSYNGRRIRGGDSWSMHAYGLAVDINPVENPYITKSGVTPALGADFVDRAKEAPGMIDETSVVVRAFAAIGWRWGGDWKTVKDYMHFSSNGK